MVECTDVCVCVTTSLLIDRMLHLIRHCPQQQGIVGVSVGVCSSSQRWDFSLEASSYIDPPAIDISVSR